MLQLFNKKIKNFKIYSNFSDFENKYEYECLDSLSKMYHCYLYENTQTFFLNIYNDSFIFRPLPVPSLAKQYYFVKWQYI